MRVSNKLKPFGYIYKITNPKGMVYIGQTFNIEERLKFYRLGHCKRQVKLYRSILKYGWEAHLFEVLETIPYNKVELDALEKKHIAGSNSFNSPLGLNLTDGGAQYRFSDSSLIKLRILNKGKKLSDETKQKLRAANLGKKQDPAVSAKILAKIKGKKRTPETCKRISEGLTGKKWSEAHRISMKNCIRRPITEATRQKMSQSSKGRGFYKKGHTYNSKKVIDTVTGEIFESLTVACKHYGYNFHTIKHHLSGRVKKSKTNLTWLNQAV